jgi:UDP-N-acetyl-D-mannosaminuronate dehydrogenase
MKTAGRVAVAGLGQVGTALTALLSQSYEVTAFDVVHPSLDIFRPIDFFHVCYPFEIPDFVTTTADYMAALDARVTVINSTVAVGTTRRLAELSQRPVVHSPVRGKHSRMRAELSSYSKFIGALDEESGALAADHFARAGLTPRLLIPPETTELAKLSETTYFALMIAWAQEVERFADQGNVDYDAVVSFYDEIGFFPPLRYFPGVIGGSCVMPNIEILRSFSDTALLRAIRDSNQQKIERERTRQTRDP